MDQHFHHQHPDSSGRLLFSIFVNALITIVQIAGGILSNSLALISDAIHNLSDTLALVLAWIANKVSKRKPDSRRTFGYQRFEILSAFVNASALTGVSIYLIYTAIVRLLHPQQITAGLMFYIAMFGLIGNLLSMLFLHRDSKHNLNVKAAYLHLLGDTLSSVAVVIGAIVIHFTVLTWIDPALTLIISMVIIKQAYQILRESVDILMQSTPAHLDLEEIKSRIEKNTRVCNVHHVHCWQLQDGQVHFEAHIEASSDMPVSESGKLAGQIKDQLWEQFAISHTTLQIEYRCCDDTDLIKQPKINGMHN